MPTLNAALPLALLLALLALLALSAGALAGPAAPLAGRWTVVKLGPDRPATPAGDVTFDADGQTLGGATACNFFRGGYRASGGSAIEIKVGATTRRGCPGPAADHERALLDALAKATAFRIDGNTLALTGADGAPLAEFVRTPDASLEGVPHKIVSYFKDGGLYSAPAEPHTSLFMKDGRIAGHTGCRPFTARYTREGGRLAVASLEPGQPEAVCAERIRDQDAAILAALPRVTAFDTSRNLIRLLEAPDGAAMLWVTPAGE